MAIIMEIRNFGQFQPNPKPIDTKTDKQAQKSEKESFAENNEEIKRIAAEHGKYVQASAQNIVQMSSLGMDKNLPIFKSTHANLAQEINASEFSGAKTDSAQKNAINNIQNKLQKKTSNHLKN